MIIKSTNQGVCKLVLGNAIPSIIAMIMVLVYNMADMFFIGLTEDPLQTAAVSLSTPIFMIFVALSAVFGMGGASLIARSLGAGKTDYAKKTSSFCFWAVLVLGVIFSASIIIFAKPYAIFLGASNNTLSLVTEYLTVVATSGPFILMSSTFSNIIRGENKPKVATLGMVLGNIINIVLDPVFILGFEMGVSGAAIATVLGNVSAALFFIIYFLREKSMLSIKLRDFTIDKSIISGILVIGIPASLARLLMSVSTIIVNRFTANYGDLAVAGIGVAMKITMLTSFVCLGFAQGVQPLLGHAYGAKNYAKFKAIIKFSLISTLIIGTILTVICYLGLEVIIRAFLADAQAYSYALSFSTILLSSNFIFGVLFVIINAVQAIGAGGTSLILNTSRQGIFFIPIVLAANAFLGLYGVVYAQPISDFLTLVVAIVLYIKISNKMSKKSSQK